MKIVSFSCGAGVALLLLCIAPGNSKPVEDVEGVGSVNGGSNCAACTVIVALVEQLADIHNESVIKSLERICSYLPPQFAPSCDAASKFLGPLLVKLVVLKADPDVACHALKFCYTDPGQATCRTLTPPFQHPKDLSFEEHTLKARWNIRHLLKERSITPDICEVPGIKEICDWIKRSFQYHKPTLDVDNDGFSTVFGLRGTAWRGKDCSDESSSVHPGAIPQNGDRKMDSNCNGIYGVNNQTQRAYEDELCAESQPIGVAVLGDSISAHFHLPPQWLDSTQISKKAFEHAVMIIENELDWPMMSSATGYGTNNWTEAITGPIDSIYLRLRKRNRCNHRDYQNIAVNGMSSRKVADLARTLARHPDKDRPLTVVIALVGNDVCNGHPDTVSHMTTPEEMYNNTMATLDYLNTMLPYGSHVTLIGLADGRLLFENVGQRIHPLATHWGKFTYSKFYDYLNCLQISPCWGWLTSNGTLRNMTTERAMELSVVLKNIANKFQKSYSNFDIHYADNPIKDVIEKWERSGGKGWQLIEPSDGFHINQIGQALVAEAMWDSFYKIDPAMYGPVNPNNDIIEKLFGDQGGY